MKKISIFVRSICSCFFSHLAETKLLTTTLKTQILLQLKQLKLLLLKQLTLSAAVD